MKNKIMGLIRRYRIWQAIRKVTRKSSCGWGLRVNGSGDIIKPDLLEIGNNVHIGDNYFLDCRGGIEIGDNTHISRNFVCYSANHQYEGSLLPYDENLVLKKVVIEKNVWIGMNVCIVPGVEIKEGAVIGLGAVVTRDVPKLAIVGGNPAKIIKYRNEEKYHQLDSAKQFGGISGRPL